MPVPPDVSRNGYRPQAGYASVRMQQGRLATDADWNEQADLAGHAQRTLAMALLGPHALAPFAPPDGFRVTAVAFDGERVRATLLPGQYWVGGVPLDAPAPTTLALPLPDAVDATAPVTLLLVLDVRETDVDAFDDPAIADPALSLQAPSTRTRVEWTLRLVPAASPTDAGHEAPPPPRLRLGALPDGAGYGGLEHRLYRLQVLRGGEAGSAMPPTFAWSRDNASRWHAVQAVAPGNAAGTWRVHLAPGGDGLRQPAPGQWVDWACPGDAPTALMQVLSAAGRTLELQAPPGATAHPPQRDALRLRGWDHAGDPAHGGGVVAAAGCWLPLEDGLGAWFEPGGRFRTGDYWQLAARASAATPYDDDAQRVARPPDGPWRACAALARLRLDAATRSVDVDDLRMMLSLHRGPASGAQP